MSVQVLSSDNPKYGYNAATGQYEDLMAAGIIDPTKVRNSVVGLSQELRICKIGFKFKTIKSRDVLK